MLSARKLHLAAGLKVHGLDLRKAELDFYMLRYIAVASVSSIETGLAYVGIIKVKIPEYLRPPHHAWQVDAFYISACATMAVALFNLVISGFLVVNAQGMTLRGPPNSVARCIEILRRHWGIVKTSLALSVISLLLAGLSISWMKLNNAPGYPYTAIAVSVVVAVIGTSAACRMHRLASEMALDEASLVHGDLMVSPQDGGADGVIDIMSEQHEVISVSRGGRGS